MRKHLLIAASVCMALSTLVMTGCEEEDKDAISMSEATKGAKPVQGKDGKDYMVVDLGLPSRYLWATCNIGANTPDETGYFFAWAETEYNKSTFGWNTYKYGNGDAFKATKYTMDPEHSASKQLDSLTTLQAEDDAAKVLLGDGWSIPTKTQFTDMINRCNWEIRKLEGTWGYLFTSKENGNTLFIPLAGFKDLNEVLHEGSYGFYWTKELYSSSSDMAYNLQLKKPANPVATKYGDRSTGQPIRAVYKAPKQ